MKETTYKLEWKEVGGEHQEEVFTDRLAALSQREFLKLTKNILYSSVCKVEDAPAIPRLRDSISR